MRNKKVIYILITIISIIILVIIGLGLTKSAKSDGDAFPESEAVSESCQQSQEIQEMDLLEQQEEQEQDTTYRTYATLAELVEDSDIPFVDDATFEAIKAAFEKVDFTGDFEIGNPDTYEEYKTIFQKLLLNEIPYIDNETGEEVYIQDSDLFAPDSIDVETCDYYFFDIDGDSEQELCIHYLDWDAILKYIAEKDEIVLCDLYTPDNRVWLLGTGKIMEWESLEDDLEWIRTFYHYDELGNEVCSAYITNVLDSSHMTSMPEYAGEAEDIITEEMKAYGAYNEESGKWYFRISFEQEYELSVFFDDARDDASEKIPQVTYTYAEFFGQNQKYRLYDSMSEIEEDGNVPYVDDAAFEVIKAAYEKEDFFGEFEEGNQDTYDEYKRIFQKLILNEMPYIDAKTGEERYINDVDLLASGTVCVEDYDYYFYDIDGDGEQELCISDNWIREAFFKYDSEKNVINLWEPYNWGVYSVLIGTGKTISDWYGASYVFQQFDVEGNEICSTYVGVRPFLGEKAPYLTSMPEYALDTEEISEGMKIQGAYARNNKRWYFRITEDQYDELCQLHQVAEVEAGEEIHEVEYSYSEFLGELSKCPVYDNLEDISEDHDIIFANEQTVEYIREIYSEIEYAGEFSKGNQELYGECLNVYRKLIQEEGMFIDRGSQYYITEADVFRDNYTPEEYTYYLFDMSGDGCPELCISKDSENICIFSYNPNKRECFLWYSISTWVKEFDILGNQRISRDSDESNFTFCLLNEKGNVEYESSIVAKEFNDKEKMYLVRMPEKGYLTEMPEDLKKQALYIRNLNEWYFRVTEKVYLELMQPYGDACDVAEEKLKEVTYSYDELIEMAEEK